ncbi:cytochrome P450 [Coniella lustricola]|uniref:Bifunctional cytochrome P450/NADPH--P450 reductase n=1 Tax=Coniella lustricola TaxID=2025994 RepID=A0A2T3A4B1_9PEZI|nr:cytochrome P450 [Coniella lustricola]
MAETTVPIPSPPGLPLVGNVGDIDPAFPLGSLVNMAETYGEIYRLNLAGRSLIGISSYALVNECCDEKRFKKEIKGVLTQVRAGVHDGLFTAKGPEEPNWGIAHRVLMPAFGPMPINAMFEDMHDIANQLAMKWARHGPTHPIHVTDDFTRLALDTLALCSMDYRFNSFYHDEMHPFIEAMGGFLVESGNKSRRTLPSIFYREADRKFEKDIEVMRKTANDVLQYRKEHPSDRKDLLTAMLDGVDPRTGKKMTDESITDNLITFLIAGHETTGGTLSFAFYNLLKHPEVYSKAQKEVDSVVGTGPISVEHVSKLQYIQAILRETLRLTPTIASFTVSARKNEIIGGKYAVTPDDALMLLVAKSQVDPSIFGETAQEFQPERLLEDNFNRLNREFPNAWKPFGNGERACIGRPFAWQESTLAIALLLQNFNFMLDDPSYTLVQQQTLTLKPKDFRMRAVLRNGLTATQLEHRLNGTSATPANLEDSVGNLSLLSANNNKGKPISIFYGSNAGTCEALARRLATDAPANGFKVTTIDSLDAAHQNLPEDGQPVIIITASYEGEPPDNAALFCNWIQGLKGQEMSKLSYAVFGCGHHDWAQTFHKIPKMVDATLERLGGTRVAAFGVADAADSDLFSRFETWEDDVLWPALQEKYDIQNGSQDGQKNGDASLQGSSSALSVEISTPRSSTLRQDVQEAVVLATKTLTAPGTPIKKNIEIQLPSGRSYTAGDYLAILPINHKDVVHRALRRFRLPWDAHVTIHSETATTLPTGHPVPASDVLGAYVELLQPVTKRSINALAEAVQESREEGAITKQALQHLASDADAFAEAVRKRISILDLLEKYPAVQLPFATFLSLLPPMRVRQYSISSSPLADPTRCTLTYSVLDAPALSGTGQRYLGVATSYLASLEAGDKLHVAIRPSHASFHLPLDVENTPIVMIAAGTGLAPFKGFVQERAAMLAAAGGNRKKLAPALLFYGCRDPEQDDLYREEFQEWQALGAVDVRRSYSRNQEASEGCKYVQDRLWQDRADVQALWESGAKVYVCGSRAVSDAVREVAIRMYMDGAKVNHGKELSVEEATERFDAARHERFATDVFD